MKTDRELLELAAKAAELDVYWDTEYDRMTMDYDSKGGTNLEEWNPLTDDGDALRLAMHLNIETGFLQRVEKTIASYRLITVSEKWENDKARATRRAIVLVAAAIGGAA